MHGLEGIIRMNREYKGIPGETETSRHCSFQGTAQDGVVLHSAKHRNTIFLRSGRQAAAFLARWWSMRSQAKRNQLVESYF